MPLSLKTFIFFVLNFKMKLYDIRADSFGAVFCELEYVQMIVGDWRTQRIQLMRYNMYNMG